MMIITWTIQIRGISFDSTVVTCSDPFVVQNDIKLIRATYFSKFHCNYSSKTNELWMSQATRFLHDMRFYFKFLTFKSQEFTIKLPQKKRQSSGKNKLPHILTNHTIWFSRTHLITSLFAKPMTNATSLRNSELYITLLESKKCQTFLGKVCSRNSIPSWLRFPERTVLLGFA